MAANLHAGIQRGINLEFQFQHEITVLLTGTEKTVWRLWNGGPNDRSVFNFIVSLAPLPHPTFKRLSIKDGLEPIILGKKKYADCQQDRGNHRELHLNGHKWKTLIETNEQ